MRLTPWAWSRSRMWEPTVWDMSSALPGPVVAKTFGVSERPSFTVEYIEPVVVEAEPLPEEFSARSLKRSLLILAAIVAVIAAAIALLPGLDSLRERFTGAEPSWL